MLTIKYPGQPKAYAIIVDEPVNGVSGIVECYVCDWHLVLTTTLSMTYLLLFRMAFLSLLYSCLK